jgi:D-arabinose 1-dehydrogenase-like Zn-dependent alcohol dehydrogenase
VPVRAAVETFPLEEANAAIERVRVGQIRGSAVLIL